MLVYTPLRGVLNFRTTIYPCIADLNVCVQHPGTCLDISDGDNRMAAVCSGLA